VKPSGEIEEKRRDDVQSEKREGKKKDLEPNPLERCRNALAPWLDRHGSGPPARKAWGKRKNQVSVGSY